MRISTTLFYQFGVDRMLEQQTKLSQTQQQVATGKKFLSPADDPPAAARALELSTELEKMAQYQTNIDHAKARLPLEEKILGSMVDELQRARELAIQANNGALGASDRDSIATEIGQITDNILALANTQDANGEYIFAGHQGTTEPFSHDGAGTFTYNGDQGQRQLQIGQNRAVAVTDPGDKLFMNVPATAGGIQDVFAMLYNFKTDLNANNPNINTVGDLGNAIDHIVNAQANLGPRINNLDEQSSINDTFKLQIQENLSSVQDLDYAEAVSRLNLQLVGLQASQQAFVKIQNLSLFNFL